MQESYLFTLFNGRFQYLEPFKFRLPPTTNTFKPVEILTSINEAPEKVNTFATGKEPTGFMRKTVTQMRSDIWLPVPRPMKDERLMEWNSAEPFATAGCINCTKSFGCSNVPVSCTHYQNQAIIAL